MLLEQYVEKSQEINENFAESRFEELMEQYKEPVRAMAHRILEKYVEASFIEFMEGRTGKIVQRARDGVLVKDYRNGYRTIQHACVDMLVLNNFRVPRNRAGGFMPVILQRIRRRAGRLAELALELYTNGVSTRKVRRIFERIGIKISGLSKSTISALSKELIQEYIRWSNRPIKGKYVYLQVDTVYIRVRKSSKRKVGTIIVIGITEDGAKEVLHFTLGTESARNCDEIWQNLIRRGFDVKSVRLVTTDGAKGPLQSISHHFGRERVQRCTVHKTANVIEKCPTNLRGEVKAKLQRLWNMPSSLEAFRYLEMLKSEYGDIMPRAINCLCEDKDDLFRYLAFPESHRKTIRNTNLIERVMREVRRRTKVMDSLDNEYGCYGILMGIVRECNNRWSKKSHWRRS